MTKSTKLKCTAASLLAAALSLTATAQTEETELKLFDAVTFYDGYLFEKNPDKDLNDGILRHSTSLYAVKMTDEQLDKIGSKFDIAVTVKACCDNYDRIGNINLALVPKDSTTYNPDYNTRIELGRFITPFMDKNKKPDEVPYNYSADYLSYILRDRTLREKYNFWVEFELFGVPYAANEQIAGCAGRSDVFKGTLVFKTSTPAEPETDDDVLVPIVMKKPEYKGGNLNNYSEQGTDTIGKTTKTWEFDVPEDVADGQIVLITSNHGANSGGEEYNRRWHYVYVDDQLLLNYKPGRSSCEPFRKYNTQANGIYGYYKKSDAAWQSFSNWCPGDVIDNRIIGLGAVKAGKHKVRISVPDAKFNGKQGDIPVSMFFQGLKQGTLTAISTPTTMKEEVKVSINGGQLSVSSDEYIVSTEVYDTNGRCLYRADNGNDIDVSSYSHGIYLVNVELADGIIETHKIAL